jgi:hypothetical protein
MIRYTPIECGVEWESHLADLCSFDWQSKVAEWRIPDEPSVVLKVSFSGPLIVRMLDDFPLSTERPKLMTGKDWCATILLIW